MRVDLSPETIEKLASQQLRKLPIRSNSSDRNNSSHSSTIKSPCCRSLRGASIFDYLGVEVIA